MTSMSPGASADQSDDTSQSSSAISAVESESEDSWQPETKNRKKRTIQSNLIDSTRRKRHKGDSTSPLSRMASSVARSSSVATPLLCSKCSAVLTSTAYLDERPEGSSPGQRGLARHTPFSEVSSDIKGSAVPNEYLRKGTQRRRSRSSVLEDLDQNVTTRSMKGIPRIRKKRPTNRSLSAIDKCIAELNDEEHRLISESDSDGSTGPDDIAWDESQSSCTQSPELEYHSPINARTRSTRRSSMGSDQQPTNDLLSSLLDFMDDLNDSEDIPLKCKAGQWRDSLRRETASGDQMDQAKD